jgi:hypothetical protein
MSRMNLEKSATKVLAVISVLREFLRADFFIFLSDLLKHLADKKDGERWLHEFKKFTSGMTCWPDQPFNPYLKKTGEGEIGPVSGRRTFFTNEGTAKNMERFQLFRFIDRKLTEALNLPKKKRPATKFDVYEPDSDANYIDLFLSLSSNIDRICWDCQDQIMSVIEAIPRNSKAFTVFFLKESFNGQDTTFVVRIMACSPSEVFYDLYIVEMKNLPKYCVYTDDGTRFIFPKQ